MLPFQLPDAKFTAPVPRAGHPRVPLALKFQLLLSCVLYIHVHIYECHCLSGLGSSFVLPAMLF